MTQRVYAELRDPGLRNAVPGHLAMVSDRYLTTTPPARIAAHLRLIERLEEEPVATDLFHHRDLGSSDLVIITRDVPGLFSLIAGCLAANGINILSAQIHTRADGMAIDTFQVNDPFGEAVTEEARWRRTLQSLRRVLSGEQTVELLLAARRGGRPADESVPGPAKVTVDNHLSDTHTVVEVKCPDRVGLLYLITRTLAHSGLSIASARIATDIDHAYDTFYVADRHGRRIEDANELMLVRSAAGRRAGQASLDARPLQGSLAPVLRSRDAAALSRGRAAQSPHRPRPGRERHRRLCLLAGAPALGAVLLAVAALFDFFDGAVARLAGSESDYGAFLDSVVDRYSDVAILFGILVYDQQRGDTVGSVLTMATLAGTFMTSYTKARAQSIGVRCDIGVIERPERLIALIAGAAFNQLTSAMALLAVLTNVTAIQRIVYTRRIARDTALR